jgi:AraC-like DNA-binding protein
MKETTIPEYKFANKRTELGLEIISFDRIKAHSEEIGYKPHRVEFYQILVFTEGDGIHEVDFQKIPYTRNTIIPIGKGQIQRFNPNPELKGYAILFMPEFIVREEIDFFYLYSYTIFQHAFGSISSIASKEILALLTEMIAEQDKQNLFESAEYQRNLLKNFIIQIERQKRANTKIVCNDSFNLYLKFMKTLEDNLSYKTRVSDICDALNVSAKQLNNTVKQMLNTTAKQYMDDRVILEIKRLLVYSSLSVKEIAYQIGFDDPTNFTKYFKTRVKLLPSDYQKQNS